ncbi:unnamed protein product [Angiostrongylus costaricensis]|uniref:SRP40_C domain-containing protein n=1 Tax=Angiostrongylus costaricensis TaxID=334426 RepID=A0A0R3Q095_ANGCS|nr:unnamed protein product [Angiostrongylus costaricensis]
MGHTIHPSFFLHSLIYYSALPSTYDIVFKRKSNEPFRRVTISKDSLPSKFKDNSFDKSHDKWGAKAHEALSKVQGKGFRHEKTKKKKVCLSSLLYNKVCYFFTLGIYFWKNID